jgi:ribosomal protein L7Ae-like RNA K-turn-binding protein
VDEVAMRKMLRLVGLGVRGRLAVVGVEQVRDAAMHNKLKLAVVAPDASRHSLDKVVPLLQARRVRFYEGPSAAELGAAVGRQTTAAVGIVDAQLARGIRDIVERAGSEPARESGPGVAQ